MGNIRTTDGLTQYISGVDYDLTVYTDDWKYVASSKQADDNKEVVTFLPPKSGKYRIRDNEKYRRDYNSDTRFAIAFNPDADWE